MNTLLTEVRMMMDQLMVNTDAEVVQWLSRSTSQGILKTIQRIEKIPGDASTRKYYRIFTQDQSFILMKMEPFLEVGMNLPFIGVQRHLAGALVEVPAILDVEPGRGFMLLEDLGDTTLLRKLQGTARPEQERHLYERAIDVLVRMHVAATSPASAPELEAFRLRFDTQKLMWEVDFCIEHFYKGYLKRELTPRDEEVMRTGFVGICDRLAAEPTVFTHRDLHSRNIMVTGPAERERLVLIDFQDARLGPAQYDLASLLRDSYYQLDEAQVDRLLDYYVARYEAGAGKRLDREHFREIFDLMSIQRNFKAIGSFASFWVKRGDPGYIKYIGNTFENIRRNLLKYPSLAPLREVLFHYYYF